jgi:glycosyltransferase involved in cell wall biosynthesis
MKIGFVFKGGRETRTGEDCPSEFLYGMKQLQERGHDVSMIVDSDLQLDIAPARRWRIIHHLFSLGTGVPLWPLLRLCRSRARSLLNGYDCLVATTFTFGICMGVLSRMGIIRPQIIFLSMGLIERTTPRRIVSIYRWAFRKSVHPVALSYVEASFLSGILSRDIPVVPFGVDTDFWTPAGTAERGSDPGYILSVGNDLKRDYRTLLAGWKPDYPLLKIVTSQKISSRSSNIEIIKGSWHQQILTDAEIRTLFQGARFVVLPISETIQPSGQSVCLQAMASGKAVVITDFAGLWNRDLMQDGNVCILAGPPGSVDGLQNAIERLLDDPGLAQQIGLSARGMVETGLSVETMGDALERHVLEVAKLSKKTEPHQPAT